MSKTWLTRPAQVWRKAYPDAAVPFGQLARYLKPLTEAHPMERVCAELEGFLAQTEPKYLSLAKFAATFGSWSVLKAGPPTTTAQNYDVCARHPDRPSVGEVSRRRLCRQCFEEL